MTYRFEGTPRGTSPWARGVLGGRRYLRGGLRGLGWLAGLPRPNSGLTLARTGAPVRVASPSPRARMVIVLPMST